MNKNINVFIYQNGCIYIYSRFTYSMINWDTVVYIETTQLPVIHSSTNNYINVIKYLMLQHIRLPALIKD